MSQTESVMLPLGTRAPDFSLPDTLGATVSLRDFEHSKALLVVFMTNHCPYVKHTAREIAAIARDYAERDVAVAGINANDPEAYPEDAPELMEAEREKRGYTFPYLFDESQEVAKSYHAACTPDFFLFDGNMSLAYRGRLDDSRPGSGVPVTGADLRAAIDAVLEGGRVAEDQKPSMGCNIKWRPGNEPAYYSS